MLFDGDVVCVCLQLESLFLFYLAFEIETNLLLYPSIYFIFIFSTFTLHTSATSRVCRVVSYIEICFWQNTLTAVIKREFYANSIPMKWLTTLSNLHLINIIKLMQIKFNIKRLTETCVVLVITIDFYHQMMSIIWYQR